MVCVTVIVLAIVGAWVYVQKQNIAQKDRDLQQQKQLKEYEQQELNKRNKADNDTEMYKNRYRSSGNSSFWYS